MASLTWSPTQYATALAMAAIDGSAAVQTATAQSKRHWHAGGRLRLRTKLLIVAEAIGQCALMGHVFAADVDAGRQWGLYSSIFFVIALLALWTVPLHAQRPLSVLLYLASALAAPALPPLPGVEWARTVLPVKYLLCHPIRHEPYRDVRR